MQKIKNSSQLFLLIPLFFILLSCETKPQKLPILGNREAVIKTVNGKEVTDTLYHQIPDFEFINQDSVKITQKDFEGKIYIADFFFTTCPTICPKMKTQMLRIYEKYKDNPKVGILSHTIDPRHDTPAVLREFMNNLGIKSKMWQMVTGDKAKIYEIGQKSYMVSATDDPTQPGGIVHSGAFILVDKNRHIRGIYDGTEPTKVDRLMIDMEILLNE
ncbi:MAG: SCO family protein [Bacteroidota bacterium]|jgi:protein SCO1/2